MNVENENIDHVTDLGLALGYSNRSIQRRLSNDLGAGSRIDIPSLKCTQRAAFLIKKHSLAWASGRTNVVLSPQHINNKHIDIDEENFNASASTSHDMNSKVGNIDNSDKSSRDNDGIKLCHEQLTDNDNSFQGILSLQSIYFFMLSYISLPFSLKFSMKLSFSRNRWLYR